MSKLDGFYDFLDKTEIRFLDDKTLKDVNNKFEEWGWRWELPKTESGKKFAILICSYSANLTAKNREKSNEMVSWKSSFRFMYLTICFLVEKGIPYHSFNVTSSIANPTATKNGLKKLWKKRKNFDSIWYKIGELFGSFTGLIDFIYLLTIIIGIIGFIQYLFGFTSNGFYEFFFDKFTANVLFFHIILCYLLNLILSVIWRNCKIHPSDGVIATIAWILKIPKPVFLNLFLFILLSIAIFFVPFHNILFNIAFFLFIIDGEYSFESTQIDFALFNFVRIKTTYYFLERV